MNGTKVVLILDFMLIFETQVPYIEGEGQCIGRGWGFDRDGFYTFPETIATCYTTFQDQTIFLLLCTVYHHLYIKERVHNHGLLVQIEALFLRFSGAVSN